MRKWASYGGDVSSVDDLGFFNDADGKTCEVVLPFRVKARHLGGFAAEQRGLGLAAALEWQLQEFQKRSETRCHFYSDLTEISLPEGTAIALFRIFQEALTNVARHAQATEVDVWLQQAGGNLELMVHDNGRGFATGDPRKLDSYGLMGLRERVLMLAGEVGIESAPGSGTRIAVRIPLSTTGKRATPDSVGVAGAVIGNADKQAPHKAET